MERLLCLVVNARLMLFANAQSKDFLNILFWDIFSFLFLNSVLSRL